jgi:predicted neutral ceramidase superfamily lipid hydrolase
VQAFCQALGSDLDPADRREYDRILAAVRAQLDEATFNAAWAEGRKMTLEQAIEYVLESIVSITRG